MKKVFIFSLLSFVVGIALAGIILINPLEWGWVSPIQDQVYTAVHGSHSAEAHGDGQLWTCGMHPQVIQDEPGTCPICGMALTPMDDPTASQSKEKPESERKIKHWVAPMDPTYISDQPGKSPMGMDLVPVYEDKEEETSAEGVVHIDPAFVQNIGVQSVEVERRDIPFSIRTIGTVAYDDKKLAWVNTKYAGWVENVRVNYVGEAVSKGQELFEIYSPDLVTTQKEYLSALDYAEKLSQSDLPGIKERALSLLNASRERLRYWDISDEQIRELEKSRLPTRTLTVFSPVSGMVLEKMDQALDGMYVKPGMNLYKIVDLSTVWVDAEIFENQVPWLKVGQYASLEFPYQPGRRYRGKIRYVYPFFNQKTRTMKVSIELPNPGLKLRAEMYANVTFNVPSAHDVLTVPEESVIHSGTRNVVVLDRGDGTFQVSPVTLGVNGNGVWEIKDGIASGDRVVVSSQFLIDSESNLREAVRKMISRRKAGAAETETEMETAQVPSAHQH
jgi:Cu(I)/Ag(I) efflux system membrane fusion protein/cobalt-zinc-cadmium efflux system membrane fusion protein